MENYLEELYEKADVLTRRDIYAVDIGILVSQVTGARKFIVTIHARGMVEFDGEGATIEEAVADALEQLKEDVINYSKNSNG
jgi:hypothetical protein